MAAEFDDVGGAGELSSVGALSDVGDDDVVDEAALELVVELTGRVPRSRSSSPVLTTPLISRSRRRCG
ncbi:hypothetical protein AB0D74_50045 [Streptomyces sp. NPDC048278]|uniref:hypothetical protein n=1 Tax=Streptomyces sp. NPDC048278 TaxID=3155809 RepID=UPI003438751B